MFYHALFLLSSNIRSQFRQIRNPEWQLRWSCSKHKTSRSPLYYRRSSIRSCTPPTCNLDKTKRKHWMVSTIVIYRLLKVAITTDNECFLLLNFMPSLVSVNYSQGRAFLNVSVKNKKGKYACKVESIPSWLENDYINIY